VAAPAERAAPAAAVLEAWGTPDFLAPFEALLADAADTASGRADFLVPAAEPVRQRVA
jgi:hypothetical protein